MRWRELDWVDIIGTSVADLLGPVGIPLKAILRVRNDLRGDLNERLRASIHGRTLPAATSRELVALGGMPFESVGALEFGIGVLRAWQADERGLEAGEYVKSLASDVWRNESVYRHQLAKLAFEPDDIRIVCRDAFVDLSRLRLSGSGEAAWYSIFEYLRSQEPARLLYLLHVAAQRFPTAAGLLPWEAGRES